MPASTIMAWLLWGQPTEFWLDLKPTQKKEFMPGTVNPIGKTKQKKKQKNMANGVRSYGGKS